MAAALEPLLVSVQSKGDDAVGGRCPRARVALVECFAPLARAGCLITHMRCCGHSGGAARASAELSALMRRVFADRATSLIEFSALDLLAKVRRRPRECGGR